MPCTPLHSEEDFNIAGWRLLWWSMVTAKLRSPGVRWHPELAQIQVCTAKLRSCFGRNFFLTVRRVPPEFRYSSSMSPSILPSPSASSRVPGSSQILQHHPRSSRIFQHPPPPPASSRILHAPGECEDAAIAASRQGRHHEETDRGGDCGVDAKAYNLFGHVGDHTVWKIFKMR